MQADSSLGQEMAWGLSSEVMPVMEDQELMAAMQATVYSISISSMECVMAALVGGETQLGWPRWSAYVELTLLCVVQSEGSLLGSFVIGKSGLQDKVSGIWWTTSLYRRDFSL